MTTILSEQLKLLTRLDVVQVNNWVFHAGRQCGDGRKQAATTDLNRYRCGGERVVDQPGVAHTHGFGGRRIRHLGPDITGVVVVGVHPKQSTCGYSHRVTDDHTNALGFVHRGDIDLHQRLAHIAIAIDTVFLHLVDLVNKTLGQKVEVFLGRLKHLRNKGIESAKRATAGAGQRLGVAIRVDHHVQFAVGVRVHADGA